MALWNEKPTQAPTGRKEPLTPVPSGADHAAAARETLSLAVPTQPLSADKPADACTLLTMG